MPDLERQQTTPTIFRAIKPKRAFEEISAEIKALEENISGANLKLQSNPPAFDANVQFHKVPAGASKNLVFLMVMESIVKVIADFRSQRGHHLEVSERFVAEHKVILDAVRRRGRMAIDLLEQ